MPEMHPAGCTLNGKKLFIFQNPKSFNEHWDLIDEDQQVIVTDTVENLQTHIAEKLQSGEYVNVPN